MSNSSQSGQVLIIILLILSIGTIIVLSLVSRSTTDLAITTKEKESSRAFSAAEAGVERALLSGTANSGTYSNATYNAQVSTVGEAAEYAPPYKFFAGDTFPLWFVSHDSAGALTCGDGKCFHGSSLKVCWGDPGTNISATAPAIEVAVYYKDGENYKIARTTIDPNTFRQFGNNFGSADSGTCSVAGSSFAFGKTINFSSLGIPSSVYNTAGGLQVARIRLIYNTDFPHPVAVSAGIASTLPSQGTKIESTGTSSDATRKLLVFKLFPDLPPVFDFATASFSSGGLVK